MTPDDLATTDILMGDVVRLQDVIDRGSASAVCKSFFDLFGIPVRLIAREGELLADVHCERGLCRYVNTLPEATRACHYTVGSVRELKPAGDSIAHACFTGAVYRLTSVEYQGRALGRLVLGPYVPAETTEAPVSLFRADPALDAAEAREHFAKMPRIRAEVAAQLSQHLKQTIELLVFSGHRAQLASSMQVANVRENYRELAEKNEKLQAAYDELKQLDQLKSTFLATVSHELRTPLTSIIGYTEMLESGGVGELEAEQLSVLKTIRTKADQLLHLISNLLDLGRLESARLELRKETIDPALLLSDVSSTIVPAANRKNIAVDIHVDEDVPKFVADPMRMRQVLLNLADNAVKFTPEGGRVALEVRRDEIRTDSPAGLAASLFASAQPAVRFTVEDSGIGIPAQNLRRIFDAFYQVDGSATRRHGGAGLGLSIAKQLVEGHGGKIEVTSRIGQGTVFVVRLPAADDHGR
jgi:two-component system sensor histidine kinase BarA